MQTVRIESPAKINLVLDLLHKRSDGYHEVEFLMQELELHDVIECSERDDSAIVLTCDDPTIYCDERNLIVKAARLLQLHSGCKKGASIRLTKNIPMVGGLGGSSSNATKTIQALKSLWHMNLNDADVLNLVTRVGMDCAFFVYGKTCIARGRGEVLERTESPPRLSVVMITPEISVPENKTAWIYGNFSVARVQTHPSVAEAVSAIASGDVVQICKSFGNAFEHGLAVKEYEPVWALLEELRANPLVLTAQLAGAGPAVFAITKDTGSGEKLQDEYVRRSHRAMLTATTGT